MAVNMWGSAQAKFEVLCFSYSCEYCPHSGIFCFVWKKFNIYCSAYDFDSESEVACESDRQYDIVFVVWLCWLYLQINLSLWYVLCPHTCEFKVASHLVMLSC